MYALCMTVILRAHHLLCLRGFVGMGYNEDFVQNMTQIKERLEGGEDVVIVDACDDICGSCPNIKNEVCQISGASSEEEMQRMDRAIIELADIRAGEECVGDAVYEYSELRQIVDANIPPQGMKAVCGECRWLEHCEKVNL